MCCITRLHIGLLLDCLLPTSSLIFLVVSFCFGALSFSSDVVQIAHALHHRSPQSSALRLLDLSGCGIDVAGVCALAEALSHNSCVVSLNIGNMENADRNTVRESGAMALAAYLCTPTCSLEELRMDAVGPVAAVVLLTHGVAHNRSLRRLFLRHNKLHTLAPDRWQRLLHAFNPHDATVVMDEATGEVGPSVLPTAQYFFPTAHDTFNRTSDFFNAIADDPFFSSVSVAAGKVQGPDASGDADDEVPAETLPATLEELHLNHNSISDHHGVLLWHVFGKCPRLELLNLRANALGVLFCQHLADWAAKPKTRKMIGAVQSLLLDDNVHMAEGGLRALASALGRDPVAQILRSNLQTISLSRCGLTEISDLTRVVRVGIPLRKLDLSHNKISNAGCEGFFRALADSPSRMGPLMLDMSFCGVGNSAAMAAADYIRRNVTVQSIVLKGNDIDVAGAVILAACKNHRSLVSVNLEENHISYDIELALARQLTDNAFALQEHRARQNSKKLAEARATKLRSEQITAQLQHSIEVHKERLKRVHVEEAKRKDETKHNFQETVAVFQESLRCHEYLLSVLNQVKVEEDHFQAEKSRLNDFFNTQRNSYEARLKEARKRTQDKVAWE